MTLTNRIPHPQPLFDTLENLQEAMPASVHHYLESIKLPDVFKEYEVSRQFLLSYGGSADTYTSYRREVERILHWSWLIHKTLLKDLNRNDLRDYLEFAKHPFIDWISTKTVSRFINQEGLRVSNPDWRPYVVRVAKAARYQGHLPEKENYQLAPQSMQSLFSILGTYFTYLQQEEYLDVNPVSLIRQKKRYIQKRQTQKVTRRLSRVQWMYVIETAEDMANQVQDGERILFMMTAFYLMGLRVSELATTKNRVPCMGDFAPDKHGLWWFTTVGKGNKVRDVAVPDEMMQALKRYRQSLNMTQLPFRGEQVPLLNKQRGRGGLGTRQIRNLVQTCFDQAVRRLQKAHKEDEAQDLMTATVHWLRHTAISMDVEERPREHVRDDVGHESATTTDRYIDIDRLARHHSAQHKHLKPTIS